MFEHQGYTGIITTTDTEAGVFHGQIVGIQDVVTFEGKTIPELVKGFRDSVEDYLAFCEECKEGPEKPFSGRFVVRLLPELHRQASEAANGEQVSLNAWMIAAVEQRLKQSLPDRGPISFEEMENLAQCVAAILGERQRHSAETQIDISGWLEKKTEPGATRRRGPKSKAR